MRTLKKPLRDLTNNKPKIPDITYYGRCRNPQCKGQYSFDCNETYFNYIYNLVATCPNCYREIKVYYRPLNQEKH
jgi:hypothetical protein